MSDNEPVADTDDLALARGVAWGVVLAVPFWTMAGWLVW